MAPTPPSAAGRLKVALLSTEVWIDTERLGPLRKLDYVALYTRLRDRRGSEAGVRAASFELEVDATATTSQMLTLYWLGVHAGYRRAELLTWAGRTALCSIDCSTHGAKENALDAQRTILSIQAHGIGIWRGDQLSGEVPGSARAPERLLDAPWKWKDDAIEAEVRRACAAPPGCSRVTTYIDPYVASGQLKRLLAVLERMGRGRDDGVVLELQDGEPTAPGDEGSTFRGPSATDSGRLPAPLISALISRHTSALYRCAIERWDLKLGWPKTAWVMLNFVIREPGAVTDIGVSGGEVPSDVLGCAVNVLEGIRFPPPEGGAVRWRVGFPVYARR